MGGETSGQSAYQEPNLSQALGQITRILQTLYQNSHQNIARLDAVLAAIMASNENIARVGMKRSAICGSIRIYSYASVTKSSDTGDHAVSSNTLSYCI